MKRGLIIIFILLFCFNNSFALENIDNNACVKPEWILEENNNKETIYEYLKNSIENLPTKKWFNWAIDWLIRDDELILYYINCFNLSQEEKEVYNEVLLMYYYWYILMWFDETSLSNEWIIRVWEEVMKNLDEYWKNNINYDYYLGRFAFFLWMGYYYEKDYQKAYEYIKIAYDRYKLIFKLPRSFTSSLHEWEYATTIDIKIWNDIIQSDFFTHYYTNEIKDFWDGWRIYEWKYIEKRSVLN